MIFLVLFSLVWVFGTLGILLGEDVFKRLGLLSETEVGRNEFTSSNTPVI